MALWFPSVKILPSTQSTRKSSRTFTSPRVVLYINIMFTYTYYFLIVVESLLEVSWVPCFTMFIRGQRSQYPNNAYVGLALPGDAGSWQKESKVHLELDPLRFSICLVCILEIVHICLTSKVNIKFLCGKQKPQIKHIYSYRVCLKELIWVYLITWVLILIFGRAFKNSLWYIHELFSAYTEFMQSLNS